MPRSETGQLLAEIKKRSGLSWDALAATIGASSGTYVRKVASGAKPGRNLDAAVAELMETGRVTEGPARRRTKAGELARVRAGAKGAGSRVPIIEAPVERPRGMFTMSAGRLGWSREISVTQPATIRQAIRAASRGHHRVSFRVHHLDHEGRDVYTPVGQRGGYDPRQLIGKLGDDALAAWFAKQSSNRYERGAVEESDIIGIEVVAE